MQTFVLTTAEELETIICRAVSLAISGQGSASKVEAAFINIDEAALLLNLAKPTIYNFVSKRLIPFYKTGKKLYFKPAELLTWIGNKKYSSQMEISENLKLKGGCNAK